MPSRLHDPPPDWGKDTSKKSSSKLDKSERRHRTSRRKSSTKDLESKERERADEKARMSSSDSRRRSSMPNINDTENKPPPNGLESKTSLPYPSFSKAHSKESVGARDAVRPTLNIFTPDATDVNASRTKLAIPKTAPPRNAPPSPPLTQVDQSTGRRSGSSGKRADVATIIEEDGKSTLSSKLRSRLKTESPMSNGHSRSRSDVSSDGSPTKPHLRPKPSTPLKKTVDPQVKLPQRSVSQPTRTASPASTLTSTESATNASSDATSIAPEQPSKQKPGSTPLHAVAEDDLISQVALTPDPGRSLGTTPYEVIIQDGPKGASMTPAPSHPPPPPPPPVFPISAPKVDYLLQNGGLPQSVPKSLLLAGKPMVVQQAAVSPQQPSTIVANLFEPYNQLLDDFSKVVSKNGSLAVATGYRSVARRLLDRLEAVFARDISSESCQCNMCERANQREELGLDDYRGVSWGEILELVSGRRDLPMWPPFTFVASPVGLGISLENHVPMQKLDIDVPEEYRDHYIRQSKKTKQSVDKWLNRQTDSPTSPPEEVDDETLTFAILTHLDPQHRVDYTNLLGIVNGPIQPPRRMPSPDRGPTPQPPPTPQPRNRPEALVAASVAIQRLYRLGGPPRDPEVAIFLLNNPTLHNALATLAAISSDEWDILISGRFDGFLRSGAEDAPELNSAQNQNTPFRAPHSRGPTPSFINGHLRQSVHPSRAPTPGAGAQYGAPIAFDEETEIATLAEIERDIYLGMEALEDAFEVLHVKAETVRNALRARSAGLAATAQRRRGGADGGIEVRMGTPASVNGGEKWENETDDGLGDWDGVSELAPDDSASNISSSRRRRPKRRHDRRTPALVEEDEDEYAESEGTTSPRKR
jgi:hypothetical protein